MQRMVQARAQILGKVLKMNWIRKMTVMALGFGCWIAPASLAQTQADPGSQYLDNIKPVPVLSMGAGYDTQFIGGQTNLEPLFSPVILVPLGNNWLIESRDTFEADFTPAAGTSSYKGAVEKEVDYLQLDYIASPYATITIGRFLTPFGIFNERLYPIWVRNLQSDPLILPLGVGPSNASTGAMVRGGFDLSSKVTFNYAGYFSTLITESPVDSYRSAGGRAGIYLPGPRLEVGGSFQHLLQDDHSNAFGFHFEWQPRPLPLDIRSEYARSSQGSGYWVESAYRLTQVPVHPDFFRRMQVVGRMQEYFVGSNTDEALLPVNTRMFEFGLNFYLRDDVRFVSSYGREFAPVVTNNWWAKGPVGAFGLDGDTSLWPSAYGQQSTAGGNMNVWTVGFTYRFVLPMGHGGMSQ
jgi:hypothetical protein